MHNREAIAEQWLERVLRTLPCSTASFVAREQDPFRNPMGHTLRQGLAILLDELLLGMERGRVTAALDSIVQIRAVQDCSPAQALEFLFQLKPILREHAPPASLDLVESRIDELALMAFDLYMKYRERIFEVRANEARRRVFILERRLRQEEEPEEWHERSHR